MAGSLIAEPTSPQRGVALPESGPDFELREVKPGSSKAELAPLLRRKKNWLIDPLGGHGFRQSILLGNLTRKSQSLEKFSAETIRQVIHEGLDKSAFEQLKAITGLPGELLAGVVGISARTLARREVFKPNETGSVLRVGAVFQRALEVLEDLTRARTWLVDGRRALGGVSPLEFCDTEPGAAEVMNLLVRIEHGVFS